MKAVIIVEQFIVGGIQKLILDEAEEFRRRNIDVRVVTFRKEYADNTFYSEKTFSENQFVCISFKHSRDVSGWKNLLSYLRREKPDVVMTHAWMANNVGRIASYVSGVPKIIAFEHSVYDGVKSSKQFFFDRIFQYLSDAVVAISEPVKQSLLVHGIKPEKISVIYNGICFDKYGKAPSKDIRSELRIPKDEFIFLFAGRLVGAKAVDILLSAFSKVRKGMLLIVGDGTERNKLEELSQKLSLSGRVLFLGTRNDVKDFFPASDCLVLPSRREGFGLVLVEALVSGIPVISSDFGASNEIVKNGENGIIVKMEDAEGLASAMNKAADDKIFYENLRAHAKEVPDKFSISTHIENLLALIKKEGSVAGSFCRFAKFFISGVSAAVADFSLLFIFTEFFHVWYLWSVNLAFGISFFVSFTLQKFWTFEDNEKSKIKWQFPAHLGLGIANLCINGFAVYFLVETFGVWYMLAQFIVTALLAIESFFVYRVIFKK
jgi:glycosyltransferase involved in cell wall biosynthesis/putative flippase GtrA